MINFGIIGTGWITESFIEASRRVEGLHLRAVYSRAEEKAKEFAAKHHAEYIFTSLEEMAQSDRIDAVYIASPNALHYEQSMLFLRNKKNVICEKSVAVSGRLVEELLATAKENGVIFMEAIKGIHTPQAKILADAIKRIGRISAAKFDYCQLSSKYNALKRGELPNIFNPKFCTGSAMDIGVYCVYPALYLFSKCCDVKAFSLNLENSIDLCGTSILYYDDKVVTLTYSKVGDGRTKSEIIGDEGTITIDKISDFDGITLVHKDGTTELLHKNAEDVLPMQPEAQSFYNFITDLENHTEEYAHCSKLAVEVSDVLELIRNECGVGF